MSLKKSKLKENSFDGAPGGLAGAVNTQPGWGTFASPGNSQFPDRFDQQHKNKAGDQEGGPAGGKGPQADMPQQDKLRSDVNQIFKKADTPNPDEIASGLQFELGRMNPRDKVRAKQIVLTNMKTDPHYYSNLHMLNIDDKKMNMNEISRNVNKTEVGKIFQEMADERPKKFEVKPEIAAVMKELWQRKEARSLWKQGKTREQPRN